MSQNSVLFLGPPDSPLISWLESQGDQVIQTIEKLSPSSELLLNADFLVSYGYRYLISGDVLKLFPDRAINLHISMLPWNRGADPNLWSFIDNTPKGVTIHHLDEGLDTGDIIVQREVNFDLRFATLASSYQQLHTEIQALFKEVWPIIKSGNAPRIKQSGAGSYHRTRDKEKIAHLFTAGWDTPVSALIGSS